MELIIKFILWIIYFILLDHLFFIITAKIYGKCCNYDCTQCKNWACTHGGPYENKGFYPVKDWSKWCFKGGV